MADAPRWRRVLIPAVVSGAPSTAVAVARGDDVLAATRAAGTLLGKPSLVRAAVAHLALSWWWSAVIARLARGRLFRGALAGLAVAVLDLGVVGRRWFPAVQALPQVPQYLDHVAFGVAVVLSDGRGSAPRPGAVRRAPRRR